MSELEENLRKSMQTLAKLVKRLIQGAEKAKVQVESRRGVQPVLSLESQLSNEKIRELIKNSEEKMISACLPGLAGKKAVEVGEAPARFLSKLLQRGAELSVAVEMSGSLAHSQQGNLSRGYIVKGSAAALPFADASVDYVVARIASPLQGDVSKVLQELGRVLSMGGQGVVLDYHPYGLYATRGLSRVKSLESSLRHVQDYYKTCRDAGIRVIDFRETHLDESVRSLFAEKEISLYRHLKGTPLVAGYFVYKPKRM